MTAHLPPNLLALFAPRPPLPYAAPLEKPQLPAYSGVSSYLSYFTDPATDDYKGSRAFERKNEKKERIQREKWLKNHTKIQEQLKEWNPAKDSKATSDAYKTLFVGKLNFNTSEHKLKREFEYYGPVKRVRLVHDLKGRPRGYAFIEFDREKDMKAAYKDAEGKKIDGRRIIVDYERGRTSKSWRPRRLGGGRGGFGRTAKVDLNQKYSHLIRDGSAVPTQTSDEGKDDEKRERERSSERDRERDKSRSERDAKDKSYSSSSSSSKYHDKGSSDRDRGTKRERERDRVGSERY